MDIPKKEPQNFVLTITKIRKRDGQSVSFDQKRITQAITKAGKATKEFGGRKAKEISNAVVLELEKRYDGRKVPTVEEIQDIVEKILISLQFAETAKAYILYRSQHAKMRRVNLLLQETSNLVSEYIDNTDWRVKENSNMTYSLQGLNNHLASSIIARYWLQEVYPQEIADAHIEGDFHIHDLGFLGPYCVGWNLQDLLRVGFGGVAGKIESRPPKHFRTALGQLVNFFYTMQGEAAGAEAVSSLDTLLAPFIAADNLSFKEVKQAIQEFLFNMNVPTRVGFQTPFTNITMDLVPPQDLGEEPVVIGGKLQKLRYKDFQKEMDLLNKAFVEVMIEGDAKGRVFTFPIPTYNITPDFDWDNPSHFGLWELAAKYGVPYFANFVQSDMKPEDARSMCCRLRLDNRELRKRGGGLFGSNPLTGSIGVVTLNLARIGYLAKDEEDFLKRVERLMDLARESLEIKRKIIERFTEKNLYPYSAFYLRDIKERYGDFWHNHFSTIGLNGLNEGVVNFLGENLGQPKGRELGIRVLEHMRNKLLEYQTSNGSMYNLEATPAEGTSYRLAKIDKKKYPQIKVANEEGVQKKGMDPFYTNSSQLPVDFSADLFRVLQLQDDLQTKYTGGTVLHIFLGERMPGGESVKNLVKKVFTQFKLPYISITPTFSVCPQHGYLSGEHESCPECQSTCEVYSRIVGYLRPVSQWNKGKRAEFKTRKEFKV